MHRITSRAKEFNNMRKAKERKRLESDAPNYPKEVPKLRKVIIIINFDFGVKINVMKLFRTKRIDQYRVEANGKPWMKSIGLSGIFAGIRKSMPRVLSKSAIH